MRFNSKALSNNKGSAMIWAMCTSAVICVVLAGLLTFSLAYYNDCLRVYSERQAMLYTRSGISALCTDLSDADSDKTWLPALGGEKDVTVTIEPDSVTVDITVRRKGEKKLSLTATGKSGNESCTLHAYVLYEGTSWRLAEYTEALE